MAVLGWILIGSGIFCLGYGLGYAAGWSRGMEHHQQTMQALGFYDKNNNWLV